MRKGPEVSPIVFIVLIVIALIVAGAWLWRSSDQQATPQLTTEEYKRRFEKAMSGQRIGGPSHLVRPEKK